MAGLMVMYIPDEGSPHMQRSAGHGGGRVHSHGLDLPDLI
jgi:hypothetical protein